MTLTAETAAFLDNLKQSGHVPTDQQPSPEAARQESVERRARLMIEAPPMESIDDLRVDTEDGEITVRRYVPLADVRSGATLMWLHGGGWAVGDIESAHAESARIAQESGAVLVSVEYRLAPEHRYPAATRDCYAALRWAAEHIDELGGEADRLVIGGVSSGGNLAAIAAQRAVREGGPALAGLILVVPALDLRLDTDSWWRLGEGYLLTRATCEWYLEHYLNPGDRRDDPALSPGLAPDADLAGLPPTLVITAEYDPLRDEDLAFVARLRALGVPVDHVDYGGVIHGFMGQLGPIAESESAFATIGSAVRKAVRG
jgi:Esterase/lipase